MDKKEANTNLRKYIRFTGMGLQMGMTIWLASLFGHWLDQKYKVEEEWFFKGVTLLAVFGSMFSFIRQVTRLSKEE